MTWSRRAGETGPSRTWRDTVWLALPFLAIVLCYAPVWLTEYGFSEDYRLLSFYDHGATNRTLMIAEGRPIQALWTNVVFGHLAGIESLGIVRLASVMVLGVCALLLSVVWRRNGLGTVAATLASTAAFTLPPFQMIASTAAFGVKPPALALAILAALMTGDASDRVDVAYEWKRLCIAFVALTIAMLAYQPAAMMYWAVAGIALLLPDHEPDRLRRLAVRFAVVGFAALAAGFAAYIIGKGVLPAELAGQGRASLSLNPVHKALWFLGNPLVQSLNLWRLYPDRLLAVAVGLALEAGLAMRLLGRRAGRARFAIALLLVPLCYLPNLMVAEDWAAFRTQIALVSLVLVYLVISLAGLESETRRWLFPGALACITATGLILAAADTWRLCAAPQARELAMVRRHMAGLPPAYGTIGVVMSDPAETLAPYALWDEFGRMAVSFEWGVASLPYLALREIRPAVDTSEIRVRDVTRGAMDVDTVLDWGAIIIAEKTAKAR